MSSARALEVILMAHSLRMVIIDFNTFTAADSNGLSDPYVIIKQWNNKTIHKTPTIKKTLNPVWYVTNFYRKRAYAVIHKDLTN